MVPADLTGLFQQAHGRVPLMQAMGQMIQALRIQAQSILDAAGQLAGGAGKHLAQGGLVGRCEFGCGGGGGCPQVGNEIADAEVRFVADGRNHRDGGLEHHPGDRLVVERHQVLQRAAAAAYDQQIGPAMPIGRPQRRP